MPMPERRLLDRLLTPRWMLGILAVILVLLMLLTPGEPEGSEYQSLTSYSYSGYGANAFYGTMHALGWRTVRRLTPIAAPLDTTAVYAVLAPPRSLTPSQVAALLDAVRHGAGLIVFPFRGTVWADSLRVDVESFPVPVAARAAARPDAAPGDSASDDAADGADSSAADTVPTRLVYAVLRARHPLPADTVVFVAARRERLTRPVVLGIPLGRGRIVAVADRNVLRNYSFRADWRLAILPVRLVEWAAGGRGPSRATLVFDEFDHGFGAHPGMMDAIIHALRDTAPGRATLALAAAALLLLAAAGARPLAPESHLRTERRSPFEHVGALARAYEQIGASRLAARRLAAGIRRRHSPGGTRPESDAEFLHRLAGRYPAIAPDVDRLLGAAERAVPPDEIPRLADATDHIERTLGT